MGFYSDTEKGEDGKLHLAIEKWQNREREVLREICKKHGINIGYAVFITFATRNTN